MEKKEELKDKAREKSEAISKLYGKSYVIHQKNNRSQNISRLRSLGNQGWLW